MGRVATPDDIAARATAGAISVSSRGSNGRGISMAEPNRAGLPP